MVEQGAEDRAEDGGTRDDPAIAVGLETRGAPERGAEVQMRPRPQVPSANPPPAWRKNPNLRKLRGRCGRGAAWWGWKY